MAIPQTRSSFERAIPIILAHEGGYVNDPVDVGGATNFGVSLRFLKTIDLSFGDIDGDGDIDADDIKKMTPAHAKKIYKSQWWDKFGYGEFEQDVATKLFDMSVNMGAKQAHKLAQRAATSCGKKLVDDGVLGPMSVATINKIPAAKMRQALRQQCVSFYEGIILAKPQFEKYRKGWMKRALT